MIKNLWETMVSNSCLVFGGVCKIEVKLNFPLSS